MLAIVSVATTDSTLNVGVSDGRTVSAPLAWYPRLDEGSAEQRLDFRIYEGGVGVHWPSLDEDISLDGLLAGAPSPEYRRETRGAFFPNAGDPASLVAAHGFLQRLLNEYSELLRNQPPEDQARLREEVFRALGTRPAA
jgi:hypothetical protein